MPLKRALMCQNWYGEAQGIRLLSKFESRLTAPLRRTSILNALQSQICDEIRHAQILTRLISKAHNLPPKLNEIDPSWRRILTYVDTHISFSTAVVGIYGLIEPFNILSTQALLFPLLEKHELREIEAINNDEEKHVSMFDLFEELIFQGSIKIDQSECMDMITFFLEAQTAGLTLPMKENTRLSRDATRVFLKHVAQLKVRVKTWPTTT